jgi:hypothetical protein
MELSIESKLLQEQLLQEAFLDSVKAYAQEKYNRVVDKISDWKDAAAVIGNVISNPTILQRFSDDVWYRFKRNTLSKLTALLNKIGLGDLVTQINNVVTKITDLKGWQKFLASTGIGAIAQYVINKMSGLAPDKIKTYITSFLSEDGLKDILSKLTDFQSYLGWLQPIIKGVDMLYAVLKDSISSFKLKPQEFTQSVNLIKKENKEMDLKEYIKQLVQQELDEMSVSGGAGGYLTPNAFAPKGQGKNAATKYAEKMGFKLAKKPAMYKESDYDKASLKGQASGYTAASDYTAGGLKGDDYYKKESMKESLIDIIEKEMINEVTYGKFKKDVKHRTKSEQLHKAIREVKKKLAEIDRIVEYTSRMKQELSEDGGINYWKATQKNVASISEMVNQLNNKIKSLNQ